MQTITYRKIAGIEIPDTKINDLIWPFSNNSTSSIDIADKFAYVTKDIANHTTLSLFERAAILSCLYGCKAPKLQKLYKNMLHDDQIIHLEYHDLPWGIGLIRDYIEAETGYCLDILDTKDAIYLGIEPFEIYPWELSGITHHKNADLNGCRLMRIIKEGFSLIFKPEYIEKNLPDKIEYFSIPTTMDLDTFVCTR